MSLEELYKAKGELITQIEIAQAKLQQINQEIIALINKPKPSEQ
jgi:hypothetical protein